MKRSNLLAVAANGDDDANRSAHVMPADPIAEHVGAWDSQPPRARVP
jgi:hypothetical protein